VFFLSVVPTVSFPLYRSISRPLFVVLDAGHIMGPYMLGRAQFFLLQLALPHWSPYY